MQGHGYAQPVKQPPPTAWLVFLRVLFVAVAFLSIGFLTWTLLLRLAVVTRKSLDWGLFVAVLTADVLSIVLLASEPGDEIHTTGGYVALTLLLGTLLAAVAYYLAADIHHFQGLAEGYRARLAMGPAYGYPQPPSPYTATTVPIVPQTRAPHPQPQPHPGPPQPHTPPPMPPAPQQPPVSGPPQRPAPARIDQVRAELDELSDYLRKHDGHHEGGR
ncbi:hypothetical protein AB0F77_05550 [Streptomyces sp. NPDC026672]|uniref:hypothetical protein n=1 Tax=unclassified Streptomyces TaxID=2593676 RepID=UPI0033CD1F0D